MSEESFRERYERLSDDELSRVVDVRKDLVPEAALALDCEVERRRLKQPDASSRARNPENKRAERNDFRRVFLFIAALLSVVVSAIGCLALYWVGGVDVIGPSTLDAVSSGTLLCLCAALSVPAFLTVFVSQSWHRCLVWMMACASFVLPFAVDLIWASIAHENETAAHSAISLVRQPVVILPFLMAFLVEIAYRMRDDQA